MNDFEYHSPTTLEDACTLLKKYNSTAYVLAGGTDLIPKMYHRQLTPEHIINIKRIPDLNKITYGQNKGLSIGALTKFNEIIYSDIIQTHYPILCEVSKIIASHQIRNLATVGGNLCNAAPSADSAPILIALDATVEITNSDGTTRTQPLDQFFSGPGITALAPGEILTQIHVPNIPPHSGQAYIKHTTRQALEIAVVGAAGNIKLDDDKDKCNDAKIVIAACAPTPLRVRAAEELLIGRSIMERELLAASELVGSAVQPITDVRACDLYRREMVQVHTKRALEEALGRANKS